ncbi:SMODS domain-containing nucleotidyltransferase [Demequina sp.]|uniref:SMODS domain-containing nucleotidyltransferase n=1 Tax=Demequina sp. TaxID=2050685 RepID=UPI003D1521A6
MADGFDGALGVINPSPGDRAQAIEAHLSVRATLERDPQLVAWGIDSVLIGSYARRVSIHRAKDVDVFCKLLSLPDDIPPQRVINAVYDLLVKRYGNEHVERQARSVKVTLPKWNGLHVDAVPARPYGDIWQIPDRTDPDGWQETNPERLNRLTEDMNGVMNEFYVPTVKLLRQTKRALIPDQRPGGLYFEAALYQACERSEVEYQSQRFAYVTALEAISGMLSRRDPIRNPTLPDNFYTFRVTDDEWESAASAFATAARRARVALTSSRCDAARIFNALLGENSDGTTVYAIPADCDSSSSTTVTTPGDSRVTSGHQRFAVDGR